MDLKDKIQSTTQNIHKLKKELEKEESKLIRLEQKKEVSKTDLLNKFNKYVAFEDGNIVYQEKFFLSDDQKNHIENFFECINT